MTCNTKLPENFILFFTLFSCNVPINVKHSEWGCVEGHLTCNELSCRKHSGSSLVATGVKALADHPLFVWRVLLLELETLILRQIDQLRFCSPGTDI